MTAPTNGYAEQEKAPHLRFLDWGPTNPSQLGSGAAFTLQVASQMTSEAASAALDSASTRRNLQDYREWRKRMCTTSWVPSLALLGR